ncbi:Serpin A11 [Galemys pyrenaicus]|uniref:Serpin A11 n=1 Tax=Galemys pyrenaicus TaxID=202257 RepID=A0A8J6A2Z7_GALPY|nr:Serpin A11 [Galemys pyrenaicus]
MRGGAAGLEAGAVGGHRESHGLYLKSDQAKVSVTSVPLAADWVSPSPAGRAIRALLDVLCVACQEEDAAEVALDGSGGVSSTGRGSHALGVAVPLPGVGLGTTPCRSLLPAPVPTTRPAPGSHRPFRLWIILSDKLDTCSKLQLGGEDEAGEGSAHPAPRQVAVESTRATGLSAGLLWPRAAPPQRKQAPAAGRPFPEESEIQTQARATSQGLFLQLSCCSEEGETRGPLLLAATDPWPMGPADPKLCGGPARQVRYGRCTSQGAAAPTVSANCWSLTQFIRQETFKVFQPLPADPRWREVSRPRWEHGLTLHPGGWGHAGTASHSSRIVPGSPMWMEVSSTSPLCGPGAGVWGSPAHGFTAAAASHARPCPPAAFSPSGPLHLSPLAPFTVLALPKGVGIPGEEPATARHWGVSSRERGWCGGSTGWAEAVGPSRCRRGRRTTDGPGAREGHWLTGRARPGGRLSPLPPEMASVRSDAGEGHSSELGQVSGENTASGGQRSQSLGCEEGRERGSGPEAGRVQGGAAGSGAPSVVLPPWTGEVGAQSCGGGCSPREGGGSRAAGGELGVPTKRWLDVAVAVPTPPSADSGRAALLGAAAVRTGTGRRGESVQLCSHRLPSRLPEARRARRLPLGFQKASERLGRLGQAGDDGERLIWSLQETGCSAHLPSVSFSSLTDSLHSKMTPAFCGMLLVVGLCAPTCSVSPSSPPSRGAPQPSSTKTTPTSQVSSSNTDFAFRLYRRLVLKTPSQNVFFSPLSVSASLAMLSLGACSTTKSQILQGLAFNPQHTPEAAIHRGFQHLVHSLNAPNQDLDVEMGSVLFVRKELRLQAKFLDDVKRLYEAEVFSTDFSNTSTALERINGYVEKETKGKVVNLVQGLEPMTAMVLVNHIFFKAKWEKPFAPADTRNNFPFLVDKKTSVRVPMMHQVEQFAFGVDPQLNCSLLQMDYKGDTTVLFVLPGPGKMRQLEQALSARRLQKWRHLLRKRWVEVFMPKFSISASYDLETILPKMGIRDAFGKNADFSGITKTDSLQVSKAAHKAVLDVDEEGTEAAAASATKLVLRSKDRHTYPTISFNKPFLLQITHGATGTPLFLGKMTDPTNISCELYRVKRDDPPNPWKSRPPPSNQDIKVDHEAFIQKLWKTLLVENPKENVIFSPMSISTSLAMIAEGARSWTLVNLLQVLGFDLQESEVKDTHHFFLDFIKRLHQMERKDILRHKDFLFINHHRKVDQRFLEEIQKIYDVQVQMIDFQDKEKAKKEIDHTVAQKVQHTSCELTTMLDPQTFLLLVNYISVRGIWQVAFDTKLTHQETFFMDKYKKVQVDMMKKTERMIYSRWDDLLATMVELPYTEDLSMVLVLPDEGHLYSVLRKMDFRRDWINHPKDTRLVELILPKFKIFSKIDLKKMLPKMGIRDIMTPEANFSGITEEVFPVIVEAVHEAGMEVNEKGMRMAANWAMDMMEDHLLYQTVEPLRLKFNKPFLAFVVDKKTQTELLVALVLNPKSMELAWLWLLGAGVLASVHCQPFSALEKSLGVPHAPSVQLPGPAPAYHKVTPVITNFALRLYKQLAAQTTGNIFFSPVSVSLSLALLSLGAQADSKTQILQGLGFNLTETPEADIHRGFQSLIHALALPSPKLELKAGTSLFLDKRLQPRRLFLNAIRELYGALAFSANFTDAASTGRQVSEIVQKQTYGRVADCLQGVSPDTLLLVLNYVFFKAKWKHPFNRYQTQKQGNVFADERTSFRFPMMHQKEMHRFLYDPEVACTVLQIEYSGNALALLLLPDPGKMEHVEAALQPETLQRWGQMLLPSLLDLHLPRFSISGTYNLEELLPHIGLSNVFSLEAGLSGVTGWLNQSISRVTHKATVDMSERGTEAGAASGLLSQPGPLNTTSAPQSHFNRPFLVLLWEATTQSLLFLGKVVNPATGPAPARWRAAVCEATRPCAKSLIKSTRLWPRGVLLTRKGRLGHALATCSPPPLNRCQLWLERRVRGQPHVRASQWPPRPLSFLGAPWGRAAVKGARVIGRNRGVPLHHEALGGTACCCARHLSCWAGGTPGGHPILGNLPTVASRVSELRTEPQLCLLTRLPQGHRLLQRQLPGEVNSNRYSQTCTAASRAPRAWRTQGSRFDVPVPSPIPGTRPQPWSLLARPGRQGPCLEGAPGCVCVKRGAANPGLTCGVGSGVVRTFWAGARGCRACYARPRGTRGSRGGCLETLSMHNHLEGRKKLAGLSRFRSSHLVLDRTASSHGPLNTHRLRDLAPLQATVTQACRTHLAETRACQLSHRKWSRELSVAWQGERWGELLGLRGSQRNPPVEANKGRVGATGPGTGVLGCPPAPASLHVLLGGPTWGVELERSPVASKGALPVSPPAPQAWCRQARGSAPGFRQTVKEESWSPRWLSRAFITLYVISDQVHGRKGARGPGGCQGPRCIFTLWAAAAAYSSSTSLYSLLLTLSAGVLQTPSLYSYVSAQVRHLRIPTPCLRCRHQARMQDCRCPSLTPMAGGWKSLTIFSLALHPASPVPRMCFRGLCASLVHSAWLSPASLGPRGLGQPPEQGTGHTAFPHKDEGPNTLPKLEGVARHRASPELQPRGSGEGGGAGCVFWKALEGAVNRRSPLLMQPLGWSGLAGPQPSGWEHPDVRRWPSSAPCLRPQRRDMGRLSGRHGPGCTGQPPCALLAWESSCTLPLSANWTLSPQTLKVTYFFPSAASVRKNSRKLRSIPSGVRAVARSQPHHLFLNHTTCLRDNSSPGWSSSTLVQVSLSPVLSPTSARCPLRRCHRSAANQLLEAARYTSSTPQLDDLGCAPQLDHLGHAPQLDDLGRAPQLDDLGRAPQLDDLGRAPQLDDLGRALQLDDLGRAAHSQCLCFFGPHPLLNTCHRHELR